MNNKNSRASQISELAILANRENIVADAELFGDPPFYPANKIPIEYYVFDRGSSIYPFNPDKYKRRIHEILASGYQVVQATDTLVILAKDGQGTLPQSWQDYLR